MPPGGIPPLRVSSSDGTFNQIPVFELVADSGATLTKLSTTKVMLAFAGVAGPSGPSGASVVYAPTGGPYITFGTNNLLSDEHVLTASNNILITTDSTTVWLSATTGSPIAYAPSGGFYLTAQTNSVLTNELLFTASDNIVITTNSTTMFISAITNAGGSSVVYAATGNQYVVMSLAGDLTNEYRLVQSGNSITMTTGANTITINATTQNITGKQDSITFPLIVTSGGTGRAVAGSATTIIGMNSAGIVYDFYNIVGSDNATVVRSGTGYFISANTGTGAASTVVYAPTGGAYLVAETNSILSNEFLVQASNATININTATGAFYISANTGGGGSSTQVIRIPMALLTVQVNSGNAYWTANSAAGFIDEAYVIHADSGKSISTWWCKVPNNLNATPAYNLEIDSYPTASSAGILVLSASGLTIASGESANGAGTTLVAGGSFTLLHTDILTTSTLTATDFDGVLATSATDYMKIQLIREGNADTYNADWRILSVNLKCTVDT